MNQVDSIQFKDGTVVVVQDEFKEEREDQIFEECSGALES